jgi:hypothetical protein
LSHDLGAERTKVDARRWSVETSPPVLDVSVTSLEPGGDRSSPASYARSGFHVDANGTVWRYARPGLRDPRSPTASIGGSAGGCGAAELDETAQSWRCTYATSVFVLQLSVEETQRLLRAASEVIDGPRIGPGLVAPDSRGERDIELTGHGTREGRPILLGRCRARDQLESPASEEILTIYRAIVRQVPDLGVSPGACGMRDNGKEMAPGVRAWFAP